jgi:hypothetical protein
MASCSFFIKKKLNKNGRKVQKGRFFAKKKKKFLVAE